MPDSRATHRFLFLLGALVFLVTCQGNGLKRYQFAVPVKTNDGWETAHLSAENVDASLIKCLFDRILNNAYIDRAATRWLTVSSMSRFTRFPANFFHDAMELRVVANDCEIRIIFRPVWICPSPC